MYRQIYSAGYSCIECDGSYAQRICADGCRSIGNGKRPHCNSLHPSVHSCQGSGRRRTFQCNRHGPEGGVEAYKAGDGSGGLRHGGNDTHGRLYHRTELFLDIPQRILQLFLFTGIRPCQFGIHLAYIVADDLGQHGSTFRFGAILQYFLLCLRKGDAHPLQYVYLPLHGLAHHVADSYGILVGGIQPLLLGKQIIHGGNKRIKARFLVQESGHLLGTAQLYLIAYYSQCLLGRSQVFNTLYLFVSGRHALPHHGLKLRLRNELYLVSIGQFLAYTEQLLYRLAKHISRLCRLRPIDDTALRL